MSTWNMKTKPADYVPTLLCTTGYVHGARVIARPIQIGLVWISEIGKMPTNVRVHFNEQRVCTPNWIIIQTWQLSMYVSKPSLSPTPNLWSLLLSRGCSLSLGLSFCGLPRFLIGQRNFLPSTRRRNSSIASTPTWITKLLSPLSSVALYVSLLSLYLALIRPARRIFLWSSWMITTTNVSGERNPLTKRKAENFFLVPSTVSRTNGKREKGTLHQIYHSN